MYIVLGKSILANADDTVLLGWTLKKETAEITRQEANKRVPRAYSYFVAEVKELTEVPDADKLIKYSAMVGAYKNPHDLWHGKAIVALAALLIVWIVIMLMMHWSP